MNILPPHIEHELAALDFRLHLLQALDDRVGLGIGDDAALGQHAAMGDTALDVIGIKPPIEQNRGGESFDDLMCGLAKAASPGFALHGNPISSAP